MNRTLTAACCTLLAGALATTLVLAQEKSARKKKAAEPPAAAPTDDMMKQMMALGTPGEAHKRLEPLVGKWEAAVKLWMAGPSGPSLESKGSETSKWVLGNRFILSEFHGEMPMPDPSGKAQSMPFEGMGMTGYDNFRNQYIQTWADSMGTQLLTMTGSADQTGKVFTYHGTMDEPALKLVGRMVRYVTRIVDADHHVFEIYDLHAGADYKVMQIDYTRKKS